MDISAIDKATNARFQIRKNSNYVYTTNNSVNLTDVLTAIPKTNKYSWYYNSPSWTSRILNLGRSGTLTSFSDFTQPVTVNNLYKIKYNSVASTFYIVSVVYGSYSVNGSISVAGLTALNTHTEQMVVSIITASGGLTGNGITYSSSTHIMSITTVLPKIFLVKYYAMIPLTSLTIDSEYVFRIRQTDITGTILSEMKYRNSSATDSYYMTANIACFTLNPNNLCFTIQQNTGTSVIPSSACYIKFNVIELN